MPGAKVLIADDDEYWLHQFARQLRNLGIEYLTASDGTEALRMAEKHGHGLGAVIIDMNMPAGDHPELNTADRQKVPVGQAVAERIRASHPGLPIIAISNFGVSDATTADWFRRHGKHGEDGVDVYDKKRDMLRVIHRASKLTGRAENVRVFIAHGHDHETLDQLKEYAEQNLGFRPRLLRDLRRGTKTWIELLEEETDHSHLFWVLLTGDDVASSRDLPTATQRRARQNVIFELGFFLGWCRRQTNRVLIFLKGDVQFPSDLHGIPYIRIRNRVIDEDEDIRREVQPWL